MFEEKKDSNLVCFQFVLENIFITFPGKRKTFPTLDLVMKVHSCASSRKKKLYTHADKPLFDPSDEWSVKFVMSLLSLWFSYFKMNGICIRRQQNNHFLPLAFLLHHQWNWLWIQQFWALWVFLCSSGQAGILFLFSQLPGKYQHF